VRRGAYLAENRSDKQCVQHYSSPSAQACAASAVVALFFAFAIFSKEKPVQLTVFVRGDMQPFEYRSVRYWSKEINETLTGG
jgi:hypothetical protein